MTADEVSGLIRQHVELFAAINQLYTAFVVLVVLGLLFLVVMCLLAAWSVHVVSHQQRELEGKFSLLIDVLLTTERNRSGNA